MGLVAVALEVTEVAEEFAVGGLRVGVVATVVWRGWAVGGVICGCFG